MRDRVRMSSWLITAVIMVSVMASGVRPAAAQDEQMGMPPMGAPEEMKKLAFMAGDWNVLMKYRMAPEAPWEETQASATTTPILNGSAHQMTFKATMMGMPFEGMGIDSYNRETGQYESYWIDSMGAKGSMLAGNFEGDKLVMQGEDIMMGQTYMTRATSVKKGADEVHWSMEVSMDKGQTWFENMQMVYTRKK